MIPETYSAHGGTQNLLYYRNFYKHYAQFV